MTEPFPAPQTPLQEFGEEPGSRRKLAIIGGVGGAVVLAAGGYFLVSGGGGGSSGSLAVPAPHHAAVASATPSVSASGETVLPVFHGSVGTRDPFAVPPAVAAALAPPAVATAAPSAPAPTATSLGGPLGTTISVAPGNNGTPTTVTVTPPVADQYLQLLAAHNTSKGWVVDVRSAAGVTNGVKPGTSNVAGTLFFYEGEDETSGSPTFVFQLGESRGGNLVPNAKEPAAKPHADKSTLVLHNGNVDGGIYAE